MSTIDKRIYIDALRQRLGDVVPANDMERILTIADEVLIDFDIQSVGQLGEDLDSGQLLEFYLMQLEVRGCAPGTIYGKKRKMKILLEFTGVPFRKIRAEHIMAFMQAERERGISQTTLDNDRHAFNAFFTWMKNEELISKSPMDRIMPIKRPKVMRLPFSDTELRLIDEAATSTRDKAIIAFLTATGCRVAEAAAVDIADIEWDRDRLRATGKGSKERIVYLAGVQKMLVRRYVDERKDDLPALFVGKGSERLTPGGIRRILTKISKQSGVEGVHPHRFRRTLATNLMKAGMPIERVQKILGHVKITTTQLYIYVDDTDVQHDYMKYR